MITLTPADCSVVELRQYTLRPGQRDVLIELFEREFAEAQEAVGMCLFGQFRDLTDPDKFVWMRGFADMESRARALEAFYYGPVWQANRDAANATMIDSDNVLLLRPVKPFTHRPSSRLLMTVADTRPTGDPTATFETEHAENTFPALPVRSGESLFVSFYPADADPIPAGHRPLDPTPTSHLR